MTAQLLSIDKRGSPATWRSRIGSVRFKALDNVEQFRWKADINQDPLMVLARTMDYQWSEVVVLGYLSDGSEHFMTNVCSGAAVIWHLERAKAALLGLTDLQSCAPQPGSAS